MFETTVIPAPAAAAPRYALFSASALFHSAAVMAVVMATLRSIDFPSQPPDQFNVIQPIAPVPMPSPVVIRRAPTPAPVPAAPPATPRPAGPAQTVAPPSIPDAIIPVAAGPESTAIASNAGPGEATSGSDVGDPNGDPNAVATDGGDGTAFGPSSGPHTIGGNVKPPVVIRRVDPVYPRIALMAKKSGVVRIRCVIDTAGHVRDPLVVFSTFPAFDAPALEAVRQWRFKPGSLHGRLVDTWFELTVNFEVK